SWRIRCMRSLRQKRPRSRRSSCSRSRSCSNGGCPTRSSSLTSTRLPAAAELLSGDNGKRVQRRLEDIAYYIARVGRRAQAGWAAAAAARLRDGVDVTKVLFFQAFIRTQLGTVAAAEQEKAENEPRLIMTPAEAMRAREAREARTRRR